MNRPALNSKRIMAGLIVLLVISSFSPAPVARAVSRTPSHALAALISPFTDRLTRFALWVRAPEDLKLDLGDRAALERLYLDEQRLNEKLRQDLSEAHQAIASMTELRTILAPLGGGVPRPANVVRSPDSAFGNLLTINKGVRDGLAPQMVVVSGSNLVGRVAEVGPVTSTVRLITASSKATLQVSIAPPRPTSPRREAVHTWAKIGQAGRDLWAETTTNDPVQVGDLARLEDNTWPAEARGFVVGKVERIEQKPDNPLMLRRVVIVPMRALAWLSRVEVIVPEQAEKP